MAKQKRELTVVERRLKSGQIFATGSRGIPLKEPNLRVREVNSNLVGRPNHVWEMQNEKGWTYATAEDLAIKPEEIGYRVQDGRLVKGQHGEVVLMKIAEDDYRKIQKAKTETNIRNTFSTKATKQAMVSAAAQEGGDEAADFVNSQIKVSHLRDSRGVEAEVFED